MTPEEQLEAIRALCLSRSSDPIEADPIWPDELLAILDGRPSN